MPIGPKAKDLDVKTLGLKEQIAALTLGIKAYVGARGELLAIEGQEAAAIIGRKAGLGGLAAFFFFFGYLLLLAGLIGIIGQLLNPDTVIHLRCWVGASLIFSGVHLLMGVILLFLQSSIGRGITILEITRAEFQKDRQWLNKENKNL